MKYKFLVIGLGSMGKRRIRCLLELGISKENIMGFDISEDRCHEVEKLYEIDTIWIFALPLYEPIIMFVCTPPDKHLEYLQIASDYKIPCFVEASVCIEGLKELVKRDDKHLIHPSATMRFDNHIRDIKKFVENSKDIVRFEYKCISYLPDWHPNEDISEFYVSKRETGACREMVPFELEWLIWIFGKVKEIKGLVTSTGEFGEIDDVYNILVRFESGVIGNITIDIITKAAKGGHREINLYNRDYFTIDRIRSTEQMYIDEIKHFLNALKGNLYHYSLKEDIEVLELLKKIEE